MQAGHPVAQVQRFIAVYNPAYVVPANTTLTSNTGSITTTLGNRVLSANNEEVNTDSSKGIS